MEDLPFISLEPSRIARVLHVTAALLALIALFMCNLNGELKALLALCLVGAGIWQWQQDQTVVVQGFTYHHHLWQLTTASGELTAVLRGEQLVLPWLVIIGWQTCDSGKKYRLVLWPDSVSQEDLRRLRVFLRYRIAG